MGAHDRQSDSDELLLTGSGRPLEGWADLLASTMSDQPPTEPATSSPPRSTVLSESVAALEVRVEAALTRLADLDGPLAQLETRVSAHARALEEPMRVQAILPAELTGHLDQLTARLGALEQTIADAIDSASDQPVLDLEPMLRAINEHRIDTDSLAVTLRNVQETLDELAARPVDPPEVEVIVTPESLAPVARVLAKRFKAGRKADVASIERLASTVSDRLSAMESRLDEAAAIHDLDRQAIAELAKRIKSLQRAQRG